MEGIIKFSGSVADVTYQKDGFITMKVQPEWVFCKKIKDQDYNRWKEQGAPNPKKYVNVTYSGPVHLTGRMDAAFAFPEEIERTCYGVGARTADINTGDFVTIYLHWHRSDDGLQVIVDETVVHLPNPRPIALLEFIKPITLS